MRLGLNPLRASTAPYDFHDVVLLVVTHLPTLDGYHAGRMEIVQTCLRTMRENAGREHTFYVWDNGSCDAFTDWLREDFRPDFLMLSQNIGKNPARAAAIATLPLGAIVAYSDDDMLFYPNWLQPQIDLLVHFPNVAAVSGYPCRVMFRWGIERTIAWARKNGKLEQGRFIPKEWEDDYADSIGRDRNEQVQNTIKDVDYRVTFEGVKAYTTAHHCQFIGYVATVRNAMYTDSASTAMALDDEKQTDIRLDQLGLRLSTTERLARHMGNVMDDGLRADVERMRVKV
jgi:hypothetical protein